MFFFYLKGSNDKERHNYKESVSQLVNLSVSKSVSQSVSHCHSVIKSATQKSSIIVGQSISQLVIQLDN